MPLVRREYMCEDNHPWNVTVPSGTPMEWPACPVCGRESVSGAEHALVDRPILGIENAAIADARSGRVQREQHYIVTLRAPDGASEVRAGHPRTWGDAVELMNRVREMPFEKAARYFAEKRV